MKFQISYDFARADGIKHLKKKSRLRRCCPDCGSDIIGRKQRCSECAYARMQRLKKINRRKRTTNVQRMLV